MFKLLNNLRPKSLTNLFIKSVKLQNMFFEIAQFPFTYHNHVQTRCKRARCMMVIMYDGAVLWNSLRNEVKEFKSLSSFGTKLLLMYS